MTMNPVWIALGSNLGDREATLNAAVAALGEVPGVVVRKVSRYHETQPVGGPAGQGPFLNAAAWIETTLTPHQLLSATQNVEDQASRTRTIRWGERTLDIDLLIYGTKFLDTPDLKLPHPRLALRKFVLEPLAEIAPEIVDTITGRTITDLLASLDRKPRLLALLGPATPLKAEVFQRLVEDLPALGIEGVETPSRTGQDHVDRISHRDATIEQLKALDARRWNDPSDRDFWRVADFRVEFEWIPFWKIYSQKGLGFVELRSPRDLEAERCRAFEFHQRIQAASDHALPRTFDVILRGSTRARKPGVSNVPTLWPESDDPDAIIAEILATCRGIEAV